jgi:hypothetical protein
MIDATMLTIRSTLIASLNSFVRTTEAVAARDSAELATRIRDLKRPDFAWETSPNFFAAK